MNNAQFIAAYEARRSSIQPMKATRIKSQPLTRAEFDALIVDIARLEAEKREINGTRDLALQRINQDFDQRVEPILEEIAGKLARVKTFADEHRKELLRDEKAKSFIVSAHRIGWRTGNRTVALLSRVSAETAIGLLKCLHLEAYVRTKEEIARDLILADCKDDKTLTRVKRDLQGVVQFKDFQPIIEEVSISEAGLKIAQGETFFVEPMSATDSAETLTPAMAIAS